MIRNHKGEPVETNVHPGDDVIQVVLVFNQAEGFEEWLDQRGWMLAKLPAEMQDPDDLPIYMCTPTNKTWEEIAHGQ